MRQSNRSIADDNGSASLEFITVGLLMLVPLVYLVIALAAIQAGALAVEGAARHAARVFVISGNESQAAARAERAIRFALADAHIPSEPHVTVTCEPRPSDCLTRHGTVTVRVSVIVPLPLMPATIAADVPLGVTLEASATQQVSRFRIDR